MQFIGTLIDFFAVLIFGLLGTLVKRGVPKRISEAVIGGMALCVVYVGINGVLEAAPAVPDTSFFSAELVKMLIMIISVAVGTVIGELIDIDRLVNKLGDALETRLSGMLGGERGNFSKGFVSCSMLFCVGAMAMNGALRDGMGDPDILIAKTVIDSVTCFIMATTLGIGCAFSAFFLLAYQGAIALFGYFLASVIPVSTVTYMSVTGSLIIILVGTNVLGITKIKTANMTPAMFVPLALAPLADLLLF